MYYNWGHKHRFGQTDTYLDNIFCNGYLPDHIYTNTITSSSHSGIIITEVADDLRSFHIISTKSAQHKASVSKKRLFSANDINLFKTNLDHADSEMF